MELIAGLILGLLGSFHCAGMCGPIALAIPLNNQNWLTRILTGLTYNTGRVITYALLGALFGLIGKGLAMGGIQQWVSIAMGGIMILSVIFPLLLRNTRIIERFFYSFIDKLKRGFKKLFAQQSYTSLLVIGILNGFLPCGLVYIAIAGAIVSGDVLNGTLYMVLFGLGTIPIMLAISLVGNILNVKYRNVARKIIPILIVIIGILFILRGSNLGIPYISPKLDKSNENKTEMKCCH